MPVKDPKSPVVVGEPIHISFVRAPRSHRGKLRLGGTAGFEIHGASFIRERHIILDLSLRRSPDFDRILIHELFHFVWVRLGNPLRLEYTDLLHREWTQGTRGELGWSSESRKINLDPQSVECRNRRWRDYVCESFCDTAAWLFSSQESADEYTLPMYARRRRERWFRQRNLLQRISV